MGDPPTDVTLEHGVPTKVFLFLVKKKRYIVGVAPTGHVFYICFTLFYLSNDFVECFQGGVTHMSADISPCLWGLWGFKSALFCQKINLLLAQGTTCLLLKPTLSNCIYLYTI